MASFKPDAGKQGVSKEQAAGQAAFAVGQQQQAQQQTASKVNPGPTGMDELRAQLTSLRRLLSFFRRTSGAALPPQQRGSEQVDYVRNIQLKEITDATTGVVRRMLSWEVPQNAKNLSHFNIFAKYEDGVYALVGSTPSPPVEITLPNTRTLKAVLFVQPVLKNGATVDPQLSPTSATTVTGTTALTYVCGNNVGSYGCTCWSLQYRVSGVSQREAKACVGATNATFTVENTSGANDPRIDMEVSPTTARMSLQRDGNERVTLTAPPGGNAGGLYIRKFDDATKLLVTLLDTGPEQVNSGSLELFDSAGASKFIAFTNTAGDGSLIAKGTNNATLRGGSNANAGLLLGGAGKIIGLDGSGHHEIIARNSSGTARITARGTDTPDIVVDDGTNKAGVTTTEFGLRATAGTIRALLSHSSSEGYLSLRNSLGTERALLSVIGGSGNLDLKDGTNKSNASPTEFGLRADAGTIRAVLSHSVSEGYLSLRNSSGTERALLSVNAGVGELTLTDGSLTGKYFAGSMTLVGSTFQARSSGAAGFVIETTGSTKHGELVPSSSFGGRLRLYNTSGTEKVRVSANSGGEPQVTLFGTNTVDFQGLTATTATAGAQTLPTDPDGFLVVIIDGATKKIPYYAN